MPRPPRSTTQERFVAIKVPSLGLAYFPVPKNACSSLKAALFAVNEGRAFEPRQRPDGTWMHIHNHPGYPSWPITEAALADTAGLERLAVVRDPLRRLVSCYKNRVLHHGELSTRVVPAEEFARAGLQPDPGFDLFIERLAEYRALSWSIDHHSAPQASYLGSDRAAFRHVFAMDDLPRLEGLLSDRAGRAIRLPHMQRGGAEFPDPEITPATRRRMLEHCAPDLGLWWEG
jgi:hypothetical protein